MPPQRRHDDENVGANDTKGSRLTGNFCTFVRNVSSSSSMSCSTAAIFASPACGAGRREHACILELHSSELFGCSPVRADARPRSRGKRKPRNTKLLRARPAAIPAGSAGACSLPAGLRWLITLSLEDGMCIYCTYYCLYCVAPRLPSSRRQRINALIGFFP